MIQLSIIIPTIDRQSILEQTIASALEATQHIAAEIIVVNDSKTSQPDLGKFSGILSLNNPKQGVASARNLGASQATSSLLLFLDDDIQINKDSIDQVLILHNGQPDFAFNPDWIYPPDLQEKLSASSFGRFLIHNNFVTCKGCYNHPRWRDNALFESPALAGFHLSISRDNYRKLGGYNEVFPHAGFEDHDFPIRMRDAGMKLFVNTKSLVYHNEADRQDLRNWLKRQVRGGQTRRVGVEIGYWELAIHYGLGKRIILNALMAIKPILIFFADLIPNRKAWDFIYFRLANTLQAISIFEGYKKF